VTEPLRVLVVDDHPVVRAGIVAMVSGAPDLCVVGECGDATAAVQAAAELRPHVVLMDLQLGDGVGGVEATRQLLAAHPDAPPQDGMPKVLVLTTFDSDADILAAIEAGASGYLLKDSPLQQLLDAVRAAARGETVLAPYVAGRLLTRLRSDLPELTARELEIVELVSQGLSNRQIGRQLFISEATVKSHLVHVFGKLDTTSRTGAVAEARSRGLIR
jgi:DNA-binding NarL/FixJ family response regulator